MRRPQSQVRVDDEHEQGRIHGAMGERGVGSYGHREQERRSREVGRRRRAGSACGVCVWGRQWGPHEGLNRTVWDERRRTKRRGKKGMTIQELYYSRGRIYAFASFFFIPLPFHPKYYPPFTFPKSGASK
jgi:hypothetical protein